MWTASFSSTPRIKSEPFLEATQKGDAKPLQLAAHSLNSSSAYIGAMRLSTLAKELEMMGRSGILERAREGAEKLREEFHLAFKALKAR